MKTLLPSRKVGISVFIALVLVISLAATSPFYTGQAAAKYQLSYPAAPTLHFLPSDGTFVPHQISFQGGLTDGNGDPVPDGDFACTFSIWDSDIGGTQLWFEDQLVPVTNGGFDVLLGSVTLIPINVFSAPNRWLGVTVEAEELLPRQYFSSVPYALYAENIAPGTGVSIYENGIGVGPQVTQDIPPYLLLEIDENDHPTAVFVYEDIVTAWDESGFECTGYENHDYLMECSPDYWTLELKIPGAARIGAFQLDGAGVAVIDAQGNDFYRVDFNGQVAMPGSLTMDGEGDVDLWVYNDPGDDSWTYELIHPMTPSPGAFQLDTEGFGVIDPSGNEFFQVDFSGDVLLNGQLTCGDTDGDGDLFIWDNDGGLFQTHGDWTTESRANSSSVKEGETARLQQSFGSAGDRDWYDFTLSNPSGTDVVTIETDFVDSPEADTYITLYDSCLNLQDQAEDPDQTAQLTPGALTFRAWDSADEIAQQISATVNVINVNDQPRMTCEYDTGTGELATCVDGDGNGQGSCLEQNDESLTVRVWDAFSGPPPIPPHSWNIDGSSSQTGAATYGGPLAAAPMVEVAGDHIKAWCDVGSNYYGTGIILGVPYWYFYGNGDVYGDWTVHGAKPAAVETDSYGTRRLYSDESAEIFFFDRGQAQLQSGQVVIELDPIFLETVTIDSSHPMLIQVTLTDDCKGIFISEKTTTSFTVKELQGGTSNATFDWEVSAKRKGFENIRLEPYKGNQ